jgi:outer membrane biosynthesis protein TonB
MLEDKIEQLIGAIEGLTDIINSAGDDLQAADNAKVQSIEEKKRAVGDLERAMHEENADAESDEPTPKPVSKKKTSKKKVSKKKVSKKKTAKNTKPATTIEQVRDELVNLERTDAKLILANYGAVKLSELSPMDFDAVIAEAKTYVEADDDLDI